MSPIEASQSLDPALASEESGPGGTVKLKHTVTNDYPVMK